MLTLQQVFDKAAVHLLTQNAKSLDLDGDSCVYRAPDGKMCAVGALIDDSAYDPTFEGLNATQPELMAPLYASGVAADVPEVRSLLSNLQVVHDAWLPVAWLGKLRDIAREHDLNTEAIDAL